MQEEIIKIDETEQHIIKYNVDLLKWYFTKNKNIINTDLTKKELINDIEKQKLFSLMTYAFLEDHYCFIRVLLYIANTRTTNEEEISYKIIIHFLSMLFPDIVFANIDIFLNLGKKDDVIYFLQTSNITEKILTYIKHKAKEDKDFKILLSGKLIKTKSKTKIKYKPNFKSNNTWNDFIIQLLDDNNFNGITV